MSFQPEKLYYKIGEVCEIVGVEPYVLRYWESVFPNLSPPKSKGGQRTYRPKDIELLLQIRRLLYDEGFTIAGARKKLSKGAEGKVAEAARAAKRDQGRRAKAEQDAGKAPNAEQGLKQVRKELENILTLLERG